MYKSSKAHYTEVVNALQTISAAERKLLLKTFEKIDKEVLKGDFKIKRIQKDKLIAGDILHATINDLERNRQHLEKANQQLSEQKEALRQQKTIIEEKSQKLSENLRKLEMSYRELEQFSYIASHDLKSPLRTISNFAQLLKRRYYRKLDAEADEFIDFIVSGVFQMNEVICHSLEYSTIGRKNQGFSSTDLNEVLTMVKRSLREEIIENQALIYSEPLPTLFVNKTGISQLLQNLIGNAIKFRREDAPIIKITYKNLPNCFEFTVADNGVGMDESYQEKAFLPFQRLNNREKPGSGIGLAICKKIVKMHQGDIWYTSQKGKGTTFIFTLCSQLSSQLLNKSADTLTLINTQVSAQ